MGGGLMQLVAYGAQDIYLTGNPQITFFKVVYRRHTNFSMEAVAQTFNGTQGAGSKVTATIARNGDLIHKMYYTFNPSNLGLTDGGAGGDFFGPNIGHTLLKEVELEIGGQSIDKHYGHWLQTWSELTEPNPSGAFTAITTTGGESATGTTLYQNMSYNHPGVDSAASVANAPTFASVPLQFWFCRNPGLALPLIALQYHEVKVSITFAALADLNTAGGTGALVLTSGQLWVDYIYLDTDERRRFAQQSHEYLIEQLQFQQTAASVSVELNFNHPVKELIFTGQPATTLAVAAGPATPSALGRTAAVDTMTLKLNGHDRFSPRNTFYFTRTQVHQHHSGFGGVTARDSIGVYSFALKPEEHQPSGTCNFSRIDNARLVTAGAAAVALNVYAVNYNVLRVMSGMGGLAYSN
jgi:hypothetical protein